MSDFPKNFVLRDTKQNLIENFAFSPNIKKYLFSYLAKLVLTLSMARGAILATLSRYCLALLNGYTYSFETFLLFLNIKNENFGTI